MRSKGTNMSVSAKKIELAAATQQDPRWASVIARSTEADGKFFYSVRTTGIYCRPSCAARRARPENVRFHATRAEAEAAGFRPCKRCKPDQQSLIEQHAAKVTLACRLIETSPKAPTLEELAAAAGPQSFPFPSRLQGSHRTDAARVRRGASKQARADGAVADPHCDAGHL